MTLIGFMIAYQENTRDVFILRSNDGEEPIRCTMMDYVCLAIDIQYDDCEVKEISIDVIEKHQLEINIILDIPNPNDEE